MTTVELSREHPSVDELIEAARSGTVLIRTPEGEGFVLEEADAFDAEVAALGQSQPFIDFLTARARSPRRSGLDQVARRLQAKADPD